MSWRAAAGAEAHPAHRWAPALKWASAGVSVKTEIGWGAAATVDAASGETARRAPSTLPTIPRVRNGCSVDGGEVEQQPQRGNGGRKVRLP